MQGNNNYAMQLLMKGYSDSIENTGAGGVANSFKQAGQGLQNTFNNYLDNQSKDEAIKNQKMQNDYTARTMEDRVKQASLQTRGMEIQNRAGEIRNEFDEKNNPLLLKHQQLSNTSLSLNNANQAQVNKEQRQTANTRVEAINANNRANTSKAVYDKTTTDLNTQTYNFTSVYDKNGNLITSQDALNANNNKGYVKDSKGRLIPLKDTEAQRLVTNYANVSQNRAALQQAERLRNANNAMSGANALSEQQIQAMGLDEQQNYNRLALANRDQNGYNAYTYAQQLQNADMPKDTNGNIILAPNYNTGRLAPTGAMSQTINMKDKATIAENNQKYMQIASNIPANATELTQEQKDAIAWNISNTYKKQYTDLTNNLANANNYANNAIAQFQNGNVTNALGMITKYIGGDFAKAYAQADAAQKTNLINFATASMKGSLSDKDMQLIKELAPSIFASNKALAGTFKVNVNTQISKIQGLLNAMGGEKTILGMPQELQQTYKNLLQTRQILESY